jgi:hypothetical protein
MNHAELCDLGAKWLKNSYNSHYRCQYIVSELVTAGRAIPDVYGFDNSQYCEFYQQSRCYQELE